MESVLIRSPRLSKAGLKSAGIPETGIFKYSLVVGLLNKDLDIQGRSIRVHGIADHLTRLLSGENRPGTQYPAIPVDRRARCNR